MTNSIRGKLADLGNILERQQIAKLTDENSVRFKIAFNSQLESQYLFGSLEDVIDSDSSSQLNEYNQLRLYRLFGSMVDRLTHRTITDVKAFFRKEDESDSAYDPVGGVYMQVQHFAVEGDKKFRIHGYFNNDGYFVVTRMDWCHLFHKRQKRKKKKLLS